MSWSSALPLFLKTSNQLVNCHKDFCMNKTEVELTVDNTVKRKREFSPEEKANLKTRKMDNLKVFGDMVVEQWSMLLDKS